jgi:hypothetical protein
LRWGEVLGDSPEDVIGGFRERGIADDSLGHRTVVQRATNGIRSPDGFLSAVEGLASGIEGQPLVLVLIALVRAG